MINKMNENISIVCENCSVETQITNSAFRQRKRHDTPMLCKDCLNEYIIRHHKEKRDSLSEEEKYQISKKMRESRKKYFDSMTDEDRQLYSSKRKDSWRRKSKDEMKSYAELQKSIYDQKSDEEKEAYSQRTIEQLARRTNEEWTEVNRKNSEGLKGHWENVSEEDKIKRITPMLKAKNEWIESLTPEERSQRSRDNWNVYSEAQIEAYSDRMKVYNASVPYEEKLRRVEKMNEHYRNLSDEEKRQLPEKRREWFYSMSPEEYNNWDSARSAGLAAVILRPEKTELLVQKYLDILGITYRIQCFNESIHPDFYKYFPTNPYIPSGVSSWRHRWDFKIYLESGEQIFLDIDGSIHELPEGSYIDGRDIDSYVKFRGIQRPYQTDGMRGFIIKCDKRNGNSVITPKSIVYNVFMDDDSVMSFQEFLEFLLLWNKPESDINDVKKESTISSREMIVYKRRSGTSVPLLLL